MKTSTTLALAAALCVSALALPAQAVPSLEQQVAASKAALTKDFLDPDSAKLRNVVGYGMVDKGQKMIVALCGEVNGKNSYGAYVGFRRFYVVAFSMVKIDSDESPAAAFDSTCKGEVVYREK